MRVSLKAGAHFLFFVCNVRKHPRIRKIVHVSLKAGARFYFSCAKLAKKSQLHKLLHIKVGKTFGRMRKNVYFCTKI